MSIDDSILDDVRAAVAPEVVERPCQPPQKIHRANERDQARYPLRLRCNIIYLEHTLRPSYSGFTCNLSLSGAGVVVAQNIFTADPIMLLMLLPKASPSERTKVVEVNARMVHTMLSAYYQEFLLGIQFKSFERNGRELLQSYIRERTFTGTF